MVLAAVLLLPGCATVFPAFKVGDAMPATQPVLLADVPFYPQTEHQCGPAALAGVLGASGVETSPEALTPGLYLPGREGSLQVELLAATRRAGRIPYPLEGTPGELLAQLRDGRPVLVLQNLLVPSVPLWHYAVVVGADPRRNRLSLNTGRRHQMSVRASSFLRSWNWGGRWGMVALRPGELPADADPGRYLHAVADFEPVAGAAPAALAYRAAAQRWPGDPRPWLALGNQAYAAGDKGGAATLYRKGLALAPQDPVLGNNLASVLGEMGCRAEARRALDAALAALPADSPWHERLQATGSEIDAAKARRDAQCDALR